MISINIIEDDPNDSALLKQLLAKYAFTSETDFKVKVLSDDIDTHHLEHVARAQVCFIDIQLGKQNGIDIAKGLRKLNHELKIIFVSAFPEYVFETFTVHPEYFLRKPIKESELYSVMATILSALVRSDDAHVAIKTVDDIDILTSIEAIQFVMLVDSDKRLLRFTTDTDQFEVHGRLDSLTYLHDSTKFFRTYRNTIVNLNDINRVHKDEVEMLSGQRLPLALSKRTDLLKRLILRDEG